ncbi:MAG: hypothetical protein QXP50_04485 [Candidatus Methanomethylicia archaeon]
MKMYIRLRDALKDFLKEHDLNISDILEVMDENPDEIMKSLQKRTGISLGEIKELLMEYGTKKLNIAILTLQVFYLNNPSGMYKGKIIIPEREEVIEEGGKVTIKGLKKIILEIEPRITRK